MNEARILKSWATKRLLSSALIPPSGLREGLTGFQNITAKAAITEKPDTSENQTNFPPTIQPATTTQTEMIMKRQMHLINAIRVWHNRATVHAAKGRAQEAGDAVESAAEALSLLEVLCLKQPNPQERTERTEN